MDANVVEGGGRRQETEWWILDAGCVFGVEEEEDGEEDFFGFFGLLVVFICREGVFWVKLGFFV